MDSSLAKGLFSAFRNPVAHEPRIEWVLTEQDALDVLGTLSMIHRRLDSATHAE
ncbi:TIGR02391 family protein [Cryobacterium aureum]|uniref:TIGR02391 family protein n=1 Tax=Cryobacterium aureum TaxID=995037 RepID=UPI0023E8328A|nr:TIGR02391 family protein [Cryobacterium aureum]